MKTLARLIFVLTVFQFRVVSAQPATVALEDKVKALESRLQELEVQSALREVESGGDRAVMELAEPKLSIYGFADSGYERWFLDGGADDEVGVLRPTKEGTFVFGNLNFYFDATIDPKWQVLIELRYTLAPHGEEISLGPPLGDRYLRSDNTAFDYSSPSAQNQLRLGSLYLERAYTEWKPFDLFRLRVGVF